MERNQNYVELWGVAESDPVFSHENHTRRFDKFPLRVERLSGQSDVPVSWQAKRCCASAR